MLSTATNYFAAYLQYTYMCVCVCFIFLTHGRNVQKHKTRVKVLQTFYFMIHTYDKTCILYPRNKSGEILVYKSHRESLYCANDQKGK